MILTAHQPAILPWLGLFSKIAAADQFVLVDTVPMDTSSQTSFENRNRILTRTGELWLTVPVQHQRHQMLREVRIINSMPWQRKHWRSLEQSYRRAPYWSQYAPLLEPFYAKTCRYESLVNLAADMLEQFLAILEIGPRRDRVLRASHLGVTGAKSELVIDLCRKVEATEYIFGANGRDYADLDALKAAGISAHFQDFHAVEYPQQVPGWTPNLSVVDALFNVGAERTRWLITEGWHL